MKQLRNMWRLMRRGRPAGPPRIAAIGLSLVFVGAARTVSGQAVHPAPVPIPDAEAPPPKPAPLLHLVEWWCEINALPVPGAQIPPEQAQLNFFVSQVISRPHRHGPDEAKAVERACRTAFDVQFGAQWRLVTARAQQAATLNAAKLDRATDMRTGDHQGHTRDFRIPD